jgi:hypothetical protein
MQLYAAALAGMSLLSVSAVSADEAEDSSAAFEANQEALSATLGVAAAASTVKTDENGVTSAVVGLSAMKMLVVRQNDDGTLSYAHVGSDAEAKVFAESKDSNKAVEE